MWGDTKKILLLANDGENCGKAGVITITEQANTNKQTYFYVSFTIYLKNAHIGYGHTTENYKFTQGIKPLLKLFTNQLKTYFNINFDENQDWRTQLKKSGYEIFYI